MVVKLKLSLRERETGRASASPPSRVQTWQAGQNPAAVPVEGVEGEGAETMERAQASQPMPRPPTPLLPGRLVQLWTPTPPSTPPPPTLPTPTSPLTSSLPLTDPFPPSIRSYLDFFAFDMFLQTEIF